MDPATSLQGRLVLLGQHAPERITEGHEQDRPWGVEDTV